MTNPSIREFMELFNIFRVYVGRPDVREQLIILGLVLVGAALIAGLLRLLLFRPIAQTIENAAWGVWPQRIARFALNLGRALAFPLLGLVLVQVVQDYRISQDQLTGLIQQLRGIFTTILLFEILMTVLYANFNAAQVRRFHRRLLVPVLVIVVVAQVLNQFIDVRRLTALVILDLFNSPLTLGSLLVATVGIYFYADALNALQTFILNGITQFTKTDRGAAEATLTLIRYLLIAGGVFFVLSQLNLDPTTLAAVTGGLSVGIGFGLREILSNFISGIILLLERSLHPNDVIEIDGELCVVERLSIRATTVRTLNNVELVVPNQTFFTSSFKTYTGSNKNVRVPIFIKTDCAIEPPAVMDLLRQVAQDHWDVLSDPGPTASIVEYANNEALFQLSYWVDDPLISPRVSGELKAHIWDALQEHNVALPFPEIELHLPKTINVVAAPAGN